jgi:hypothetical protein
MADDWSQRTERLRPPMPKPPSDRWALCGCPTDAGECRHIRQDRVLIPATVGAVLLGAVALGAILGSL